MESYPSRKRITVFLPFNGNDNTLSFAEELAASELTRKIFLVSCREVKTKYKIINTPYFHSSAAVRQMAASTKTDFALIQLRNCVIKPAQFCFERFISVAENTSAGILFSDFYDLNDGKITPSPVIEYQPGSVRDDFDFGAFILIEANAFKKAAENQDDFNYAGFYSLRLSISRHHSVFRIPEFLYTTEKAENKKTGESQFDYVDPKNREAQIEMEKAFTFHLKKINAFLKPVVKTVNFNSKKFEFEASVIIPVKSREKTIADAVNSALSQKADFRFNVIAVDNYSTDSTTIILRKLAEEDARIIHLIAGRKNLGIGGCWNEGIFYKDCGKFAVQLDSDDIYKDENTLQKIVDKFYEEKCGMVIGSYQLTDFNLNEIPPGIIEHREWTDENGRNNALRINGLGAPRAFYTPIIRKIKFPDVSYGEDYAVTLAVFRNYKIGRIYEPVYICRRWEGNSDSSLTIEQRNKNNFYKDRIRTIEIMTRQKNI